MKAKEQILQYENQKMLSSLLERYDDSDWLFYLTLKQKQENGITVKLYTHLSDEELIKIKPSELISEAIALGFELRLRNNGKVLDFLMKESLVGVTFFEEDEVEVEINNSFKINSPVKAHPAKGNFKTDFSPGLNTVQIKVTLINYSKARADFELKYSNVNHKVEYYLKIIKNRVFRSVLDFKYKPQDKLQAVVQEVCDQYQWSITSLDKVEPSLSNPPWWDFGLTDVALLRAFCCTLSQNSSVVALLKAKRLNNILDKYLQAERQQELEKFT